MPAVRQAGLVFLGYDECAFGILSTTIALPFHGDGELRCLATLELLQSGFGVVVCHKLIPWIQPFLLRCRPSCGWCDDDILILIEGFSHHFTYRASTFEPLATSAVFITIPELIPPLDNLMRQQPAPAWWYEWCAHVNPKGLATLCLVVGVASLV